MDPLERADATLARARARGAFVVTPESAVSPMDATNTLQIPRIMVAANDERRGDPDTLIVPNPLLARRSEAAAENVPAIAQESFTDVVSSPPGIRSRQRRIEDARARQNVSAQQRQYEEPEQKPKTQDTEELDGSMIPTNNQLPTMRSLSQRLEE